MINRAALICFHDINGNEDDVFHFKYIVMQANQTKGFRREFFSFAQIVHLLNILLLFTKYQSRSSFESNWMCCWKKLSMGTIPHQIYTSRLTLPIHIVQSMRCYKNESKYYIINNIKVLVRHIVTKHAVAPIINSNPAIQYPLIMISSVNFHENFAVKRKINIRSPNTNLTVNKYNQ